MARLQLESELEEVFRRAERDGLRLALRGKFVALVLVGVWILVSRTYPTTLYATVLLLFLGGLGGLQYALTGSRHDRPWFKYAFISVDILILTATIAASPFLVGEDLPPIVAFRFDTFYFFYLVVAVAALSFAPGLVLWSGVLICACWWALFGWIVSGMETTVTWSDISPGSTRDDYLGVLLSPDFTGFGSRLQETVIMLIAASALAVIVHRARQIVLAQMRAERDREVVTSTFGRYVPATVAQALIADKGVLSPVERTATVLFVDIEGFTTIAEPMPPESVISMLNTFFESVAGAITDNNGVVIQFLGDAVMATFNVPLEDDHHAENAVRAANQILSLIQRERFQDIALNVRIGVSTGPVAAGTVGGSGRQTYTVYGDTVNLASRLEALNKEHGTRLLISDATAQAAAGAFDLSEVSKTRVRGKQEPVALFTLREGVPAT